MYGHCDAVTARSRIRSRRRSHGRILRLRVRLAAVACDGDESGGPGPPTRTPSRSRTRRQRRPAGGGGTDQISNLKHPNLKDAVTAPASCLRRLAAPAKRHGDVPALRPSGSRRFLRRPGLRPPRGAEQHSRGQMRHGFWLTIVFLAIGQSSGNRERVSVENDEQRCQRIPEQLQPRLYDFVPRATSGFSDVITPIVTMNVVLTSTPNPFWMSIPSVESKPGYSYCIRFLILFVTPDCICESGISQIRAATLD
jgi:hypothetical protein